MAHPVIDLPLEPFRKAMMERLWINMATRTLPPPRNEEGQLQVTAEFQAMEARDRNALEQIYRDFSRKPNPPPLEPFLTKDLQGCTVLHLAWWGHGLWLTTVGVSSRLYGAVNQSIMWSASPYTHLYIPGFRQKSKGMTDMQVLEAASLAVHLMG